MGINKSNSLEIRPNILLVDDSKANLVALGSILDDLSANLLEASSGQEAIEIVSSNEICLVLLDVSMPGLNGFETARIIRRQARSKNIPIIFITAGDIERSELDEGYRLGAADFLVKPLHTLAVRSKVSTFLDLYTERLQGKQEAEQLKLLVNKTTDYAIFMLDPDGKIATWNAGAERLKGYKAEEIIGQHFSKFYPQEAIDRDWPAYELKVALAEGRFEDEGWRLRKDGTTFWANVVITAIRDDSGILRGFSKVTRDLTSRMRSEEELRRSEERMRLLVESVKDYAIFQLDPFGHIASWNAGAERIKGYKAQEIIGKHFSVFYPKNAVESGWPDHELEVAKAQGRFEDEGWRIKKDGSQFWANVIITALKNDQGTLVGFSKITRDLTARKEAETNSRRLIEEATARRVAEENSLLLYKQRERLHVTLASIGDAVICTDAEGKVEYLNPVAEELTGWTTKDASGMDLTKIFTIVNENTRETVENPAIRALAEGHIVGLANHTILISKDGTERPIDDSAAPIKASSGALIGSVLVFRDISERREVERTIQESELRYRLVGEAANDAIWDWNLESDGVTWNEGVCRVFGYAEKDVGIKSSWWLDHIHPEDRVRVMNSINSAVSGTHGNWQNEYRFRKADNTYATIFDRGRILRANGKAIRMVGCMLDLTERRRVEAELNVAEDRFAFVRKSSGVGFWYCDLPFDQLEWDENVKNHFHLPKDAQVSIEAFFDRIHPSDREPTREAIERSIKLHEPYDVFYRTFNPDTGDEKWIRAVGRTTYTKADKPIQFDGITFDVTKQKAVEAELRDVAAALSEANHKKDEFLATLAHELRNPLAPMRNALQLMRLSKDQEVLSNAQGLMERQMSQMVRLVDDLMDVSRITRGKVELRREKIQLADVMKSAVEISRPLIDQMNHRLQVALPDETILIDADPTRMAQVFSNLLNNAAKYSEVAGGIFFNADAKDDYVEIMVRDTGIGISQSQLARIFDMFAQVDQSLERSQGGLGIGLTLVKRLVEMHRGTVEARSEGLGKGSEFIVRIPRARNDISKVNDPKAGLTPLETSLRVLIVDDNRDGAESLAMMLKVVGHETRTAHDGEEGVRLANSYRPQVILFDIGLPKLNGYEACRSVRAQPWGKEIVLVAVTGWGQEEDVRKSKEAGFNHHLVKPVELASLMKLFSNLKTL